MGDYSSAESNHGRFDNTRWSVVLEAIQSRAPGAPQALTELCERYWQPLYAFARRRGHATEAAQDLVQGFFEHLLASRGLATVDRAKGIPAPSLMFSWSALPFVQRVRLRINLP